MITGLSVSDFTLFSEAAFRFGALNVLHGANSSGKTHLLKLAYCVASTLVPRPNDAAPVQPTKSWLEPALGSKLGAVFRPEGGRIGRLARRVQGTKSATVRLELDSAGSCAFAFSTRSDRSVAVSETPSRWLDQAPVYFPARELLSVYPGFVSLYETQAAPGRERRSISDCKGDERMPSGDAHRVWFPEMIEALKRSWSRTMSWAELADLCERMTDRRKQIREERGIQAAKLKCKDCGEVMLLRTDVSGISIRSALFVLKKSGVITDTELEELDKSWARHRKDNGLDAFGRTAKKR
ncbi:MAG: hypothetical protein RBU37_16320 [Myxococcota bacterium]|jgi:hypothetical protein|nr:hypothetical protein [Myxococcota bacterium]